MTASNCKVADRFWPLSTVLARRKVPLDVVVNMSGAVVRLRMSVGLARLSMERLGVGLRAEALGLVPEPSCPCLQAIGRYVD